MAIVRRRIDGPQSHHEQRGGIVYRDTRTVGSHIQEWLTTGSSAFGLVGLGGITYAAPALTTILTPLALAYAGYVLTRPVDAPIRLPAFWKRRDPGNPVPHPRKTGKKVMGPATGATLLGFCEETGKQIWVSPTDQTMHMLLPGSTGAGKTEFIYSLLCSTLAQGGGFAIVDGKASSKLPFSVQSMARRWGREADVRVINMLVANGDRKTNTWNPFSSVNADGMTELLLTLFLPDDESGDGGGGSKHFHDRAASLIRAMARVLAWLRDHTGLLITSDTLRSAFASIQHLHDLTEKRLFWFFDAERQVEDCFPLPPNFPADLLPPIASYVQQTGGFSKSKDVSQQDKVREQHSYVVGGFDKAFNQMGSTLGHIFRSGLPDIDFHDIIYNRRILVVLLPSLENHPRTNAALGRLVITALRQTMASALGTSIEGNFDDLVTYRPSASKTPFPIVFDEVGYYAARGIDAMMAQGRELNVMIVLSFQEVGSLLGSLGKDWIVPLLGNPVLKIFLKIEDSGPTREWVMQAAGTMHVSVMPGKDSSSPTGLYADQQRTDTKEVSRVSWSDIQNLRQGEAIILFQGRRIYAQTFFAGIQPKGANRVFPTLDIVAKALSAVETTATATGTVSVRDHLRAGDHLVRTEDMMPLPGILGHFYDRLASGGHAGLSPMQMAQYLLSDIDEANVPVEAVRQDPFAPLFRNRPSPAQTARPVPAPHKPAEHAELIDRLAHLDAMLGGDPGTAVSDVRSALKAAAGHPA